MSFAEGQTVEVERRGVFRSIRFEELQVGDSCSHVGECWFVDTKLERFRSLEARAAFRCRGRWYLKMNTGNLVHRLVGNLPFGVIDMKKPELILEDPMVGRLALTRIDS